MTDTKWINETATRYGKGGDPSIHSMMKVAIDAERERCAKIADAADRDRYANQIFQGVQIAAKIRQVPL